MEQGPPVGKPIQIELHSRYRELLEPAMARIRAHLDALPELIDIDDTRALPSIEWRMQVDRAQAALYGADVVSAGVALQLVTNGVKIAEYRPSGADDAVDIRARFPAEARGYRRHGRAASQHPAGAHTAEQFRGDCARTGRGHLRAH
jgi:multidrug efflux pump